MVACRPATRSTRSPLPATMSGGPKPPKPTRWAGRSGLVPKCSSAARRCSYPPRAKIRPISSMACSSRSARAPNPSQGIPDASNSHFVFPAPRPTSSRPSVRTSGVSISRASSAGFQNGTLGTSVPSLIRVVACAAATTIWNGA